jgi:Tfp pilus assembly protein PilF
MRVFHFRFTVARAPPILRPAARGGDFAAEGIFAMWRSIFAGMTLAVCAFVARADEVGTAGWYERLNHACAWAGSTAARLEACTTLIGRDKDGRSPETRLLRGIAYLNVKDVDSALADFNAVLAKDPGDALAHIGLARCYDEQGDIKMARSEASLAVTYAPDSVAANYVLGHLEGAEGAYKRAIARFNKVIALDPTLRDAYFMRGYASELIGDTTQAEQDYSKMLAMNPQDGIALEARAVVRRRMGLDAEAAADRAALVALLQPTKATPPAHRRNLSPSERRKAEVADDYDEYERRLSGSRQPSGRPVSSAHVADDDGWAGDAFRMPAAPTYESNMRPPKYIPYTSHATESSAGTGRTRPGVSSYNPMDRSYNPYETVDEARHGRGKKYDPFATFDSWQVDRSNPYARTPNYRGVYSPFGVTPLKPPNVLGGTRQQNNWETNRYDPYGTRRNNNYNPYAPARNGCPDRTSPRNPLNPYQPAC